LYNFILNISVVIKPAGSLTSSHPEPLGYSCS
jgi:hypothetical protein